MNNYNIETRLDGLEQPYFVITAKGKYAKFLPRDNEFRTREDAEEWIKERQKRDRANLNRAQRDAALRSIGMKKTPYGWE